MLISVTCIDKCKRVVNDYNYLTDFVPDFYLIEFSYQLDNLNGDSYEYWVM